MYRPFLVILASIISVCAMLFILSPAFSRDNGQWGNTDPEIRAWYRSLMQPDNPTISCCGENDAYYAEIVGTAPNGDLIAEITDTRPDEPLGRPHIKPGTRVEFPRRKLKVDAGNPIGRSIVFVGTSLTVYCFVAPGGV